MSELEQNPGRNWILPALTLLFATGCSDTEISNNVPAAALPAPVFIDETLQRGLAFSHLQGEEALTGVHETLGSGACAFDYDNDGWTDLFLVNGSGLTRYYGKQHWWSLHRGHALFRNEGGRFRDVTEETGLNAVDWGMGCATADIDNDGDEDLFLSNYGANRLFENTGSGRFEDISTRAGIAGNGWSTGAAFGDFDGDGLLDIYVTNYVEFKPGQRTFEEQQQFDRGMARSFDPRFFTSVRNELWHNLGNGQFENVAINLGVADEGGRGLMAQWVELDEDGRLDLVISNDAGSPVGVYLNKRHGFESAGEQYRLNTALGVRAINLDDANRDGRIDLLFATADGRPPVLLEQRAAQNDAERFADKGWERFAENRQAAAASTFGMAVEDFNADGFVDIFLANGFVTPDQDVPRLPQGQRATLLIGQPDGRFLTGDIADAGVTSARGVVVADFDNDGLPDLYVSHNNDVGRLLMNRSSQAGGTVSVELPRDGDNMNTVVTMTAGQTARARMHGSSDLFGSNSRRLHFGTGEMHEVMVELHWPDGGSRTYKLQSGKHWQLHDREMRARDLPREKVVDQSLALTLGERRPANRAAFVDWRLRAGDSSEQQAVFSVALRDEAAEVRERALRIAIESPRTIWLPATLKALTHEDAATRLLAVAALEQFEAESSVRWLILALNDVDPFVRQRVAMLFAHWFGEDEAVTQRKFLALPSLIHRMEDSNENVRIAAIRALGEAERYRSLEALSHRLEDPSIVVRTEVVRALGKIRERESRDLLYARRDDPKEAWPVRAAAIVALQRLGVDDALEVVRLAPPRERISLINAILADPDRATISRTDLAAPLTDLVGKPSVATDARLALELLTALCATGETTAGRKFAGLADHRDAAVRLAAWQCRLDLQPDHSDQWRKILNDPDPTLRNTLFRKWLSKTDPSANKSLLLAALQDSALRRHAAIALACIGDQRHLQAILNEQAVETGYLVDAIACVDRESAEGLLSHADSRVRAAAMTRWAGLSPAFMAVMPGPVVHTLDDKSEDVQRAVLELLLRRHEVWANEMLETIMANGKDVRLLRFVLENAHLRAADSGVKLLEPIIAAKSHPLRRVAIETLAAIPSDAALVALENILLDESNDEDTRFIAARRLWEKAPEKVLRVLKERK